MRRWRTPAARRRASCTSRAPPAGCAAADHPSHWSRPPRRRRRGGRLVRRRWCHHAGVVVVRLAGGAVADRYRQCRRRADHRHGHGGRDRGKDRAPPSRARAPAVGRAPRQRGDPLLRRVVALRVEGAERRGVVVRPEQQQVDVAVGQVRLGEEQELDEPRQPATADELRLRDDARRPQPRLNLLADEQPLRGCERGGQRATAQEADLVARVRRRAEVGEHELRDDRQQPEAVSTTTAAASRS